MRSILGRSGLSISFIVTSALIAELCFQQIINIFTLSTMPIKITLRFSPNLPITFVLNLANETVDC